MGRRVLAFVRQYPNVGVGAGLLLLVAAAIALVVALVPYDPLQQRIADRLQGPSAQHLLGTDAFGRDVLARVAHGGLLSLRLAAVAVCLGSAIGSAIGLLSGAGSGALDRVVVAAVTILQSLPALLFALLIATVLGSGELSIVLSIAATNVALFARLVRGEVLRLRGEPYIEATRSVGSTNRRIVLLHLVPNLRAVVLIAVTMRLSTAILLEAVLSYLGLGIAPPAPTWGNMILEGQRYLDFALWLSLAPGAVITSTVLGLNVLGDGLRDVLDPRLRVGLQRSESA